MEAEPLDDASLVATATAVDDSSPPESTEPIEPAGLTGRDEERPILPRSRGTAWSSKITTARVFVVMVGDSTQNGLSAAAEPLEITGDASPFGTAAAVGRPRRRCDARGDGVRGEMVRGERGGTPGGAETHIDWRMSAWAVAPGGGRAALMVAKARETPQTASRVVQRKR